MSGKRGSLSFKIFILIELLVIISILTLALASYQITERSLIENYTQKLTSIREGKKSWLESYIKEQKNNLLHLAESPWAHEAFLGFEKAFAKPEPKVTRQIHQEIEEFYQKSFLPKLQEATSDKLDPAQYQPSTNKSVLLQHYYFSNQKHYDQWVESYNQHHDQHHIHFKEIKKRNGYYDIFLIEPENGNILYSVAKEVDFATSLLNGPFKESGLAEVFKKARAITSPGQIAVSDYQLYAPSYYGPAFFMAAPIFKNRKMIGVVAVQLDRERLNQVMTSNYRWQKQGFGKTGEAYLVGTDNSMRNDSRFFIENQGEYLHRLRELSYPEEKIEFIQRHGTTAIFQQVQTEAAKLALNNNEGILKSLDYREVPVLIAYSPLQVFDLKWALIAKIDQAEIQDQLDPLKTQLSILGLLLILLASIGSFYFSRKVSRPLIQITENISHFHKNQNLLHLDVHSNDEVGILAESFKRLASDLQQTMVSKGYLDNILGSMSDTLIISYSSSPEEHFLNSVIQMVNRSLLQTLGYEENELLTLPLSSIVVDTHRALATFDPNSMDRGEKDSTHVKVHYRKKDGSLTPMLLSASQLVEAQSNLGFITVGHDISEFERTVEELNTKQSSLDKAQEIAHVGNWVWDIGSGDITWSNEIYRIFGFIPQAFVPSYERFMQSIHPEDREAVSQAVTQALENREVYRIEHRILLPDESIKVVLEKGEAEYDNNGQPLRMIGTVLDITSLKQMQSSLEVNQKVFDNAIEGITITDQKANILYANPAFGRITGWDPSVAVGKNMRMVKSQRQEPAFYKDMWDSLLGEGHWEGEIWNRRRNGQVFPEWLAITQIPNPISGEVRYVAIFHDLSELKASQEKLEFQISHDALTGLPGREVFRDRLFQLVLNNPEDKVAVILINMDRFQAVNSSLGFLVGDELLIQVAKRLTSLSEGEDTLARWGGDEFGILKRGINEVYDLIKEIKKIQEAFEDPFLIKDLEVFVTLSIGVSLYPDDCQDPPLLISNAQQAQSKAKSAGGSRYSLFTPEMDQTAQNHIQLESNMRKGIDNGEFIPHFQPKVSIESGKIVSSEALVRWEHPEEGLIPPYRFISLAEETGLIEPIGEVMLIRSCKEVRRWREAGIMDVSVGVNLSARQFNRPKLVQEIEQIILAEGLKPTDLELEVTESLVMHDLQGAIKKLNELREAGIKISMDDFGTGYSSLSYLKQFPLDTLKIDQSFIRNITQDPQDARIVKLIVELGRGLGLNVIAEGVETKEHLGILTDFGCDEIQGYLFSKPIAGDDFFQMLKAKTSISDILKKLESQQMES